MQLELTDEETEALARLIRNAIEAIASRCPPDPALLGDAGPAINHRALQLDGTTCSVHDALEFHQHAVAGSLDDTPRMLADFRVYELAAMRLEPRVRAFFVRASREYPATSAAKIAARRRTAGIDH